MLKNTTYITAGLCSLLLPIVSFGATIAGDSSVAGLGFDIFVTDVPANTELELLVLPPYGSEVKQTFVSNDAGEAGIAVAPLHTNSAGIYKIFIEEQPGVNFSSLELEILPDVFSIDNSSLQISNENETSQGTIYTISAIARDRFDNLLPDRTIQLTSSRSTDTITAVTNRTNAAGEQKFTIESNQGGNMTLSALDALSNTQFKNALTVNVQASAPAVVNPYAQQQPYGNFVPPYPYPMPSYPIYPYGNYAPPFQASLLGQTSTLAGPIDNIELKINGKTGLVTVQKGNTIDSMTITMKDANGNTVEGFTGEIQFASSDTLADMATAITMSPAALGSKLLVLCCTFYTGGEQFVQASYYDEATGNIIEGTISIIVEDPEGGTSGKGTIDITSHNDGETIGSASIVIQGEVMRDNGEPLKNGSFIARGLINDVPFSTDSDGKFSFSGELDAVKTSQIIRIEAPDGNAVTSSLNLTLDLDGPTLEDVAFLPTSPLTGQDVEFIVKSEPNLKNVTAIIGALTVTAKEQPSLPGTYKGSFTQQKAGTYQVAISASDLIGNTGEIDAEIKFSTPDLDIVKDVRLTPGDKQLTVNYKASSDTRVKKYQIYYGDEEDVFSKSFMTDGLKTEFVLDDLIPGKTYWATVTALSDKLESARSEVVSGSPLGTALQATPGPQRVDLAWLSSENLDQYLQLIIEYGISADALTETSVVANGQRAHQQKDLLNIEYFFTLSGLNEDGTKTLLASSSATPLAIAGVPVGVSDPIPNVGTIEVGGPTITPKPVAPTPTTPVEGGENLHAAPGTVSSGSDIMWWLYLVIALAVLPLTFWRLSLTAQQVKTERFTNNMDRKYAQEKANVVRLG